jgi:hydroxypyruvate isomerase
MIFCHAKVRGLTPDHSNDSVLDYRRILSILQAAGYRGYISVEYVGPEDPIKTVPAVVGMFHRCLAEVGVV